MEALNHIFIIPDADRRHARREYLVDLFRESPRKFRSTLEKSLNKRDISVLEERIKEFSETGKDPFYKYDLEDLLYTNKIHAPLDYLINSYRKGGQVFNNLIRHILQNNICGILSIYALQKRNLDRTDEETYAMLKVEPEFFRKWANDKKIYSQCNFKFVGDKQIFESHKNRPLVKEIIGEYVESMEELEKKSKGDKLKIYVLTPYDYEWEVNQAVINGKFNPDKLIVKESVDLIIRSGNAKNPISGGLPIQIRNAQFISVKKYFPDITIKDFQKVLNKYDDKKRESGV